MHRSQNDPGEDERGRDWSRLDAILRASILDDLTLAEAVLTREAHRALSAPVFGVGNAFLRAARAVERLIGVLTSVSPVENEQSAGSVKPALNEAAVALKALEAFLPPSPGRFSSLWRALRALGLEELSAPENSP